MQKVNRRLDRKLKEMAVQAEEERRHADQNKEQVQILLEFVKIYFFLIASSFFWQIYLIFWDSCLNFCFS